VGKSEFRGIIPAWIELGLMLRSDISNLTLEVNGRNARC
jgi:hypothetical protein